MEGPPPTYSQAEDSQSTSEHTEGARKVPSGFIESSFHIEVGLNSEETDKDQEEPAPESQAETWQEKDTDQEEPLRSTERLSFEEVDARMPDSSIKGPLLTLGLVAASIAALLIVILVPLSFSDLEYYEVGICLRKHCLLLGRGNILAFLFYLGKIE